jgi:hypothetical protein
MTDYAHGSCFCKKIKFRVALPAHWVGHCHCTQCQRLHGSAFTTWTTFKTDDYTIDDPERVFRTIDTGRADRGFCSQCGSSFYFKYHPGLADAEEWENSICFTLANFETPIAHRPECHIYYDFHAAWLDGFEDLPEFEWGSGA